MLAKLFHNVLLCLRLALGSSDPCLTRPKGNEKITHLSGVHYLPCGSGVVVVNHLTVFKVFFNPRFI